MLRFTLALTVAVAAGLPLSLPADDADANRGRLLYANHCTGCHTSQAHVRSNRKARTHADLRRWVRRWEGVQELRWSDADVRDVASWLYLRFYDPERPRRPAPARGTGASAAG